jgi:SAM-dependent methyltransferase
MDLTSKNINLNIYCREPIEFKDGIPVFSVIDDYIDNYEKISSDHVGKLKKTGENPFIEEKLWKETEDSTAALIEKYSEDGQKILDVGVGLGRLLSKFPNLDKYGLDISSSYLKLVSEKNIQCCYSKIEDMPYKDEFFDIIVCTDVLEHVLDLNLAVTNILRVLKKDGILIIRVPYKEDLEVYLDPEIAYYYIHVRSFDEYSLQLLFTRSYNLKVLEWNTCGTYMMPQRFKWKIPPIKILDKAFKWYFNNLKKRNPSQYEKNFHELCINTVVKKQKFR